MGQPGDPNANTPEGVAHGEPDSMSGEVIDPNPNMNAPAHLEGAESEALMEAEVDQLLEVEDGATRKWLVSRGPWVLESNCKSLGSAALPRKGMLDHSPCHHYPRPSPQRLLGRTVRRPSTQDANHPSTRLWRGFGAGAVGHAATKSGRRNPYLPSV
jgi:hypothetical protein